MLTLALGIGANVAIYQALDAVLFRELPVADPAGLVQVQLLEEGSPVHVSYPLFRELAERQQVFQGVIAVSDFPLREAVLRGRGELRGIKGSLVSGGYFRLLGVRAQVGRTLRQEDDRAGATPVAVLSDAFWAREFGRSPAAIGQVLRINNATATVIGVAPPEFFGETVGSAPDVWLPVSLQPQVMPGDWINAPSSSWLTVIGRLRAGVSRQQAQAALNSLYSRLLELTPTRPGRNYSVRLEPANRGINELESRFGRPLWLLQCIAGLALLIACSNLAGLLLARATARESEIGVRLALGAGRGRLMRQLLTESLLLGLLGAVAAMPLASWGARGLVALASAESWRLPVRFGATAFGITLALALLAACLFGLAPALAAARLDVNRALQAGRGRGGGRAHANRPRADCGASGDRAGDAVGRVAVWAIAVEFAASGFRVRCGPRAGGRYPGGVHAGDDAEASGVERSAVRSGQSPAGCALGRGVIVRDAGLHAAYGDRVDAGAVDGEGRFGAHGARVGGLFRDTADSDIGGTRDRCGGSGEVAAGGGVEPEGGASSVRRRGSGGAVRIDGPCSTTRRRRGW